MTQLNIHWLCPEATHYHAHFFNALSQAPDISLIVHFLKRDVASHPWRRKPSMRFEHRTIEARWGMDWHLFRLALDRSNQFVISGWNKAFLVLFAMWLAVLRRDFVFWSDTPNLKKRHSTVKRTFRGAVTAMVLRAAHKVLGTGRPAVEAFAAMGCPRNKLVSFPFFVPLDGYDPEAKKLTENGPIRIVSLGRLDNSLKGYDVALGSLGLLKHEDHVDAFEYSICGTGPDEANLRDLVQELDLTDNVDFRGWVEADSVREILHSAHILLHPARWDPFPVAVLEAMAAGVVVLGSEVSGSVADRIVDGVNGFRHAAGDVETIRRQLRSLTLDPHRLSEMGAEARRTAESWPAPRGVEIIRSAFLS